MKTLLPLLFCLPYVGFAAVKSHTSQYTDSLSMAIQHFTPLNRAIGSPSVDTLPYTVEEIRRNTKTGQVLLCVGVASISPPIIYLAGLLGTPVLAQLMFSLGVLSFFLGAAKFIQSRIRLRRLQRRKSNGLHG